jgi:hypothetical protein
MYTYMLYEAERPRTPREQRELNTINGELALALMRPFRRLRMSRRATRAMTRQLQTDEQPRLRVGAFRSEATISQARCN